MVSTVSDNKDITYLSESPAFFAKWMIRNIQSSYCLLYPQSSLEWSFLQSFNIILSTWSCIQ